MNDARSSRPSLAAATIAGWILLLVGDLLTLWWGYQGVSAYRLWRLNRLYDPPAAEVHLMDARANALAAGVGLLIAGVGLVFLFRQSRSARDRQD